MDRETQLQHAFRSAFARPALLQPATVLATDKEKQTATVVLTTSQTETEARLQALGEPTDTHFLVIPKAESSVLVAELGEEHVVLLTSEIEEVAVSGYFSLHHQEASFKTLLGTVLSNQLAIIEALQSIKVTTAGSLTGTLNGAPFSGTFTSTGTDTVQYGTTAATAALTTEKKNLEAEQENLSKIMK